jgi:hypothetical protein
MPSDGQHRTIGCQHVTLDVVVSERPRPRDKLVQNYAAHAAALPGVNDRQCELAGRSTCRAHDAPASDRLVAVCVPKVCNDDGATIVPGLSGECIDDLRAQYAHRGQEALVARVIRQSREEFVCVSQIRQGKRTQIHARAVRQSPVATKMTAQARRTGRKGGGNARSRRRRFDAGRSHGCYTIVEAGVHAIARIRI